MAVSVIAISIAILGFNRTPQQAINISHNIDIETSFLHSNGCRSEERVVFEACLAYRFAYSNFMRLGRPKFCPEMLYLNNEITTGNSVWNFDPNERYLDNSCFLTLYVLRVIGIVPFLVDAGNQNFLLNSDPNFKISGSDAELCLLIREGICGSHVAVSIKMLELLNIKAKPVEFYFIHRGQRRNHIGIEVFLDGKFRYVDPTFSGYWTSNNEASFQFSTTSEVLSGNFDTFRYNSFLYPYGYDDLFSIEGFFSYLNENASVVKDGEGKILIRQGEAKMGIDNLALVKNYIGDNLKDGAIRPISFELIPTDLLASTAINVITGPVVGINKSQGTKLCLKDVCFPLRANSKFYFDVKGSSTLSLKGDLDGVYGIINRIIWTLDGNKL